MDLYQELIAIVKGLEARNTDYAVCGGIAMAIHGLPRFTKDIDILALEKDIPQIEQVVADCGYLDSSGKLTFARGTPEEQACYRYVKCEGTEFLMFDVLVVSPVLSEAWESRQKFKFKDLPITVVSRSGLGIMKRRAGRKIDLADLETLGLASDVDVKEFDEDSNEPK